MKQQNESDQEAEKDKLPAPLYVGFQGLHFIFNSHFTQTK